ncbi:MAG: 4Fe-4S binding protein [Usitatibacteraceae bacterium]
MNESPVANLSRRAFLFRSEAPPSLPRVALNAKCLTLQGVYCENCRDACETGALRFVPQLGAVPKPALDVDLCTQCSACAEVCPEAAIDVRPLITGEAKHG